MKQIPQINNINKENKFYIKISFKADVVLPVEQ